MVRTVVEFYPHGSKNYRESKCFFHGNVFTPVETFMEEVTSKI